ncbi:MAG: hypothetical protein IPM22_06830 [Betaproteobacteria bacterium]|nr:hypothetical protein [Betaproteobacteria bacterium]
MNIRSRIAAAFAAFACATGAFAQGSLVDVVEYYNATLDHYFIISSLAGDINALDSGALRGWTRTGQVFKAYDAPAAGTSPVCRFYLPPRRATRTSTRHRPPNARKSARSSRRSRTSRRA